MRKLNLTGHYFTRAHVFQYLNGIYHGELKSFSPQIKVEDQRVACHVFGSQNKEDRDKSEFFA